MDAIAGPLGVLFRGLCMAGLVVGSLHGCADLPDYGRLPGGPAATPHVQVVEHVAPMLPGDLPPDTDGLRLGIAPATGVEHARIANQPLADILAATLGVPVELAVAESYGQLIDWTVDARVDIVILPPLSYVKARHRVPELQPMVSKIGQGVPHYSSFFVVRSDDPAQALRDLEGRTIAFVDPSSTSGFLLPYAALLDHGINPQTAFKKILFAGSHRAALQAVVAGRADAAATGSGMRKTLEETDVTSEMDSHMRILHMAGRVPYDVVCARPAIPASGVEKITHVFLTLNTMTPAGRALYRGPDDSTGWMRFDDERYDALRRVLTRVRAHLRENESPRGGTDGPG